MIRKKNMFWESVINSRVIWRRSKGTKDILEVQNVQSNTREALQMCKGSSYMFSSTSLWFATGRGCWTIRLWSGLIQHLFSMLFDTEICFKMEKLVGFFFTDVSSITSDYCFIHWITLMKIFPDMSRFRAHRNNCWECKWNWMEKKSTSVTLHLNCEVFCYTDCEAMKNEKSNFDFHSARLYE